jgi:hypothetical protein
MSTLNFSLLSFNLHGFQSGNTFLASNMSNCTVACVQKHWLYDWDLAKLNSVCSGFNCVSLSSMQSTDFGKVGRPYGGLAIYYSNACSNIVNLGSSSNNRVMAIKLMFGMREFIIFNVYFPCLCVNTEYFDEVANICGFIDSAVQDNCVCDTNIVIM